MDNKQQPYWQDFGMRCDPFSEQMDHEPCYLSLQWKQYLNFLSDLDNYQHALVTMTGAHGVGKTTMMFELVHALPESVDHYVLFAEDCTGAEKLLEIIAEQFHVPLEEDLHLSIYDKANQQLTKLQQTARRHLLLVDDADQLPLDVQQILLHLVRQQLQGTSVLQVVLFGQSSVVAAMQRVAKQNLASENENLVNNLTLDPFDREETAAYLQHRFVAAGLSEKATILTTEDLDNIFQQSRGIAQHINELTANLLRSFYMEQQHQKPETKSSLKRYIWWVCTIAVIAVLLVWVLPMLQSRSGSDVKQLTLPDQQAAQQASQQPQTDAQQAQQQQDQQAAGQQSPDQSAQQQNPNPDLTQPAGKRYPADQTASPDTAQQTLAAQQADAAVKDDAAQHVPQQPVVDQAADTAPVPPVHKPTHHEKVAAAKHAMLKHKHAVAAAAGHKTTAVEQQLLKINPHYYTIQLIGLRTQADAEKFIKQYHIQAEAVYFHTYYQGKDWYVVISGDYVSQTQAQTAIHKLPAGLVKLKPWIRSFASVQQAIKMKPGK
ncbi:MAG: SPOR domain-containing protein [Gammaproteobacteria bacterium]|nr:SPOR domain-containing protein [Gammaproteobacteria bacterium]